MGDLLLNNLEVRSFRGFRHLKIERLGRVNLIVGKNNVGKSALLEALRLYASKGSPTVIWELLGVDEESKRFRRLPVERQLSVLKYLFYGRKEVSENPKSIQIGPIDSPEDQLTIGVGWETLVTSEDHPAGKLVPNFSVKIGSAPDRLYPLDRNILPELFWRQHQEVNFVFVSPQGLSKERVAGLWDSVVLTPLQGEVLAALRIIAPGVEGLNLVADLSSILERVPIIKVQGVPEPLPLTNLGDGMHRMLGVALALVNAKDGLLLIDEIENGLHYSVLPSLWQIIFQLAQRLNIQVFATSHSKDCIEAFQRVAEEDKQTEGMLIRLETKKGEIAATLFDERELNIATREQIEVR